MANYRIIDGNQGTLIRTTDKLNEALRIRYDFEMLCGTNEAIIRDENGSEIDPEHEMEYVPETMWWKAEAQYTDGTAVQRLFEYNENQPESEQQYQIECWLIERHDGCTWYSVDCITC